MKRAFFVTGTDTDVGKTVVCAAILHKANSMGKKTIGLKPVAAGCENTPEGLRNSDALTLQGAASLSLHYDQINPVTIEPAIAPHIGAQRENKRLSVDRLAGFVRGSLSKPADLYLIEGAGGWRVPVNTMENLSGLPKMLSLPVILVVGVRLGCINHALLTAEAINNDGLVLAGWVANTIDGEMDAIDENIESLAALIHAPCLGVIPYKQNITPEVASEYLVIDNLFSESKV